MSYVVGTDANFNDIVPENGLAVVDFWAEWCGPCKAFGPIFEKSAENNPEVLHIKVNVDENPQLSQFFDIRSIPTTVFIKDRTPVHAAVGALNAARLDQAIAENS